MITYVPAIKAKTNDLSALSLLSSASLETLKPLVEMPLVEKGKTPKQAIEDAVRNVSNGLPDRPFFFDPFGATYASRGKNASDAVKAMRLVAEVRSKMTPTIGLGRGTISVAQLKSVVSEIGQGICFRLEVDDLDDAAEDTWTQILQTSADLSLSATYVDIIFDLRFVRLDHLSNHRDLILDFLALQPRGFAVRDVVVMGSSALPSVADVPVDGVSIRSRDELYLWANIQFELSNSRKIIFGDYGIINPDFRFTGPNPNANAKIRYTTGSRVAYFRGHGLFKPARFGQYHELAQKVADSEHYLGKDFSFGDLEIHRCALKERGPGNLGMWVMSDMNHHLALSAEQAVQLQQKLTSVDSQEELLKILEQA